MSWLVVAAGVVLFTLLLQWVGVVPVATEAIALTRRATAVMRDAALDEDQKEVEVRRASGALLVKFVSITLRAAVALGVPVLAAWLLDRAGLIELDAIVPLLYSWEVIVGSCLIFALVWYLGRRR